MKSYEIINKIPLLSKVILCMTVGILLGGRMCVFTIGEVSAKSNVLPNTVALLEATHNEQSVIEPIEPPIDKVVEQPVEELPKTIYYDCPLSYDLQDYIRELCEKHNVPMLVVIAIIKTESAFYPNVVSGTSDYGLMQINKINHEWLSDQFGITDFLNPYQNVFCGITIFSQHYSRFNDINKSLMAYNLGATGAKRLWDKGVYETSYTQKINKAMEEYSNEIQ